MARRHTVPLLVKTVSLRFEPPHKRKLAHYKTIFEIIFHLELCLCSSSESSCKMILSQKLHSFICRWGKWSWWQTTVVPFHCTFRNIQTKWLFISACSIHRRWPSKFRRINHLKSLKRRYFPKRITKDVNELLYQSN